jgi:hypothetical protein
MPTHASERKIRLLGDTWILHHWSRCPNPDGLLRFHHRDAALTWLLRFRSDLLAMSVLRELARDCHPAQWAWRFKEEDFLRHLAGVLAEQWHVHLLDRPVFAGRAAAGTAPVSKDLPVPRWRPAPREAAAPALPPPEPDTLAAATDGAATAAALCRAADLGVPFCEECQKAAMARSAA